MNQVTEEPKAKNAEAEENLKKAEFNFMVDSKPLIHKNMVDPELLQLTVTIEDKFAKQSKQTSCWRNFFGFHWTYRKLWFFICGWQNCNPRRIEEAVVGNATLRTYQLDENAGREQQ